MRILSVLTALCCSVGSPAAAPLPYTVLTPTPDGGWIEIAPATGDEPVRIERFAVPNAYDDGATILVPANPDSGPTIEGFWIPDGAGGLIIVPAEGE